MSEDGPMRRISVLLIVLLVAISGIAQAQSDPRYIPLGPANAALYRPNSGPPPHVAILVTHRTASYLTASGVHRTLEARFPCFVHEHAFRKQRRDGALRRDGTRCQSRRQLFARRAWNHKGHSVRAQRRRTDDELLPAVAEQGVRYCRAPERIVRCDDTLAGLPKADGIVFADAHPGNPVNVLRGLNPSVIDESDPPAKRVDASLDPFDPKNGFNPNGASHYSPNFQRRYYAAQSKRMNALLANALAKVARMKDGSYGYPDDDVVVIPRGGNPGAGPGASAALFVYDPAIPSVNSTIRPEKLLRNDGTIVRRSVDSVFAANPNLEALHQTFNGGTKLLSVRSFLSANATRSTDSIEKIDDCSSNNSTLCAVASITVPELFTAMGGHYFIRDVEREYDAARSKDKDYVIIEGATHFFTPCVLYEGPRTRNKRTQTPRAHIRIIHAYFKPSGAHCMTTRSASHAARDALGFNLVFHRAKLRLSQTALAKRAGISRPLVSEIEHGRANVTIEVIERLAVALGVNVPDLFTLAQSGASDADIARRSADGPEAFVDAAQFLAAIDTKPANRIERFSKRGRKVTVPA